MLPVASLRKKGHDDGGLGIRGTERNKHCQATQRVALPRWFSWFGELREQKVCRFRGLGGGSDLGMYGK